MINEFNLTNGGDGQRISSRTVVLATGTFLRGQINIGLEYYPAGRIGMITLTVKNTANELNVCFRR
jgi:tRNA U34 5-carboxymethylaminomethyl modifying enzyme MnmG/GidA